MLCQYYELAYECLQYCEIALCMHVCVSLCVHRFLPCARFWTKHFYLIRPCLMLYPYCKSAWCACICASTTVSQHYVHVCVPPILWVSIMCKCVLCLCVCMCFYSVYVIALASQIPTYTHNMCIQIWAASRSDHVSCVLIFATDITIPQELVF